jgi:hypothetical protein
MVSCTIFSRFQVLISSHNRSFRDHKNEAGKKQAFEVEKPKENYWCENEMDRPPTTFPCDPNHVKNQENSHFYIIYIHAFLVKAYEHKFSGKYILFLAHLCSRGY